MKAKEFAAMKPEELTAKIAELKEELFNLRFRLATGQLENTSRSLWSSAISLGR